MKFLCTIAFLLNAFFVNDYELIIKVVSKGNSYTTDLLENVYVVNQQMITKYNGQGLRQFSYNNNNLGNVTYIDASDTFRVLVFYKDFNQVVFLDKTLSLIGSPLLLDDLALERTEIACSSNTGGFWVFNSLTSQLMLVDNTMHIKSKSNSINSIISSGDKANCLIEKNDFIYISFPATGIIIFDKFGAYYKTVPLLKCSSFQVAGNNIIYFKDNKLHSFNFEFSEEKTIDMPEGENILDIKMGQDKLFIFNSEGFSVYRKKGL